MNVSKARKILSGPAWDGDLVDIIRHAPNREKARAWAALKARALELPNNSDLIECVGDVAHGHDEHFPGIEVISKLYQYKAKRLLSRLNKWIFKGWATP